MKATLTLNNKEYKVDLNKLIQLGVVEDLNTETEEDLNTETEEDLDNTIEFFEVGDVFRDECVSVLILETNFPCGYKERLYQIAGLDGLRVYSDFSKPVGFNAILEFLNNGEYKFVKNINADVVELING